MEEDKVYLSHRIRLEKIYEDSAHPKENLVIINRYIRKNKHKGLSPETIQKDIKTFAIFSKWCIIPIMELTDEDIYDFLDYLQDHIYIRSGKECHYSPVSVQSYKACLKKFFKSVGKPELIEALQSRLKNDKVIERDQLLSKEDIEALLNASMNSRDRAIISVLYEAGPRKGELLSVKCRHVEFDSNGVKLTFPEGKTGPRTVRVVFSASYLRAWIKDHPLKIDGNPDPDAYLFVSLQQTDNQYTRLSDMGLYNQIQKIAHRIGLNKRVNPHSFRHSRATELAEHLTEQQMKRFLGWSPDSKMCSVYVHDVNTESAVLNMYGMEIEETHIDGLRVGRCPWCKELNPESYSYCGVCGRPLNQAALDSISEHEKQVSLILEVFGKLATGEVSVEDVQEEVKRQNKKRD